MFYRGNIFSSEINTPPPLSSAYLCGYWAVYATFIWGSLQTFKCIMNKCRYSKFKTFSMAHNWHLVLRLAFLELILWRVQMSIEKTISNMFLSMTVSTNIIYLFSKIRTIGSRSFLTEIRTVFIKIHSFSFSYTSRIQISFTFSLQS